MNTISSIRFVLFFLTPFLLMTSLIGQPTNQSGQTFSEVINIDSRLELFTDHYLIDTLRNTQLVMHEPEDKGPVLYYDKPWEGLFCGYTTVIKTEDKYQLYYRGLPNVDGDGSEMESTCYAESPDGIHWQKPDLGLFEIHGTRQNNATLANAKPVTHNFSPFLDTRQDVDPQYSYKALGGTEKSGLIAYVSADGIHWKKLQEEAVFTKGKFDSQNVSFWSESEQCYVCYFRTWTKVGYSGYRTVSRTTSKDFIHWTTPVEMTYGDTPREHIYINQTSPYYRAPHIYVATAARFMLGRQVLTEEEAQQLNVSPNYFKDCSDVVLLTSRGGNRYDRTFMSAFINPGIGLQNWVSRSNYPALNVVQTGPAEMSIYVNKDYAQPTSHLNRYAIRLDGFVSVHAPYDGGEMITKPFTFKGDHLVINFITSAAGGVQVEIQEANGKVLPGYSAEESTILIGNEIERIVSWNKSTNVGTLAGKPVRLRFVMKDAHLYSIRFQ
jgi:hypothetical protein